MGGPGGGGGAFGSAGGWTTGRSGGIDGGGDCGGGDEGGDCGGGGEGEGCAGCGGWVGGGAGAVVAGGAVVEVGIGSSCACAAPDGPMTVPTAPIRALTMTSSATRRRDGAGRAKREVIEGRRESDGLFMIGRLRPELQWLP